MSTTASRVFIPPTGHLADGNMILRYPFEHGAWIWHPDKAPRSNAFLRFRLRFTLQNEAAPVLHVTGDQRFQLRCDGNDVTFGPDRCDPAHWTVQSVRLPLARGEHEMEALVWWIGEEASGAPEMDPNFDNRPITPCPPMAQMSLRGGFLLYTDDLAPSLLNTGEAPWVIEDLTDAVGMKRPVNPNYLDVGPNFTFDLNRWKSAESKPATLILAPLQPNVHGVRRPGWCLAPAELPEQRREPWAGGTIRAARANWSEAPYGADDINAPQKLEWQRLVENTAPVSIPANTKCTILWDLKQYRCGYPSMTVQGGKDALIEWEWAEALYEAPSADQITTQTHKGNRDVIDKKIFFGIGDRWIADGREGAEIPSLWWRSGRYIRLRVATGAAPLTISRLGVVTTGFPFDRVANWRSSDPSWDRLMPLFENAFRCSGHETWTDTPYYEQLSYLSDDSFHAFSNYAWFRDTRLSRRSIQLFDWSRRETGMAAERYPSGMRQESPTFAMLWPGMIRDYAMWCEDVPFIKSLLPGLRSLLAEFESLVHPDDLLHHVPGWPFMDWVPGWYEACAPGMREGDSSLVNLHWTLGLLAAGQIEDAYGDPILAGRCRQLATRTFDAILARYWDNDHSYILDTHGKDSASEHALAFALLTGLLDPEKTKACLEALRRGDGLAKATISASFYVLNALYLHGEEAEFHRRLEFWRTLPEMGFTSTPEMPEPTRSDAHAWGAHPAWFTLSAIAGVRPAAPAFGRVRIAPLPGSFTHFEATVRHPRGTVNVNYDSANGNSHFIISLPEGITGSFEFRNVTRELSPGNNEIVIPQTAK